MPLLPFEVAGGMDFTAAWVNAVLIDALYHKRRDVVDAYAAISGSSVVAYDVDPTTFAPDYCVLQKDNNFLVVIAGTTNKPQWASHIGSSFWPSFDPIVNQTVVGSFQIGEAQIELPIASKLVPRPNINV